jgi:L-malate glycosyltransferase
MKILYTNFHNGAGGGHTTYVMNLAQGLKARHEITVAAPAGSWLYKKASETTGVGAVAITFSSRLNRTWWRSFCALRALLRQKRFDIVHVNGSPDHRMVALAVLGMGRRRPRIVYTKHNDLPGNSLGNALRASLATDRVVCVCQYSYRMMQKTPYRNNGLHIVYNGIDTDFFAPASPQEAESARRRYVPNADSRTLILGSNAGTPEYKGWMDMVEAVAALPQPKRLQVRILLAGDEPQASQRAAVEALSMTHQVIFVGLLQDVRPFISALDVGFVLSYRETISFSCREMMAMGKPVIVSDHGGLPENISPGVEGWVVPTRSPDTVVSIILGLLRNPQELECMGESARKKSLRDFSLPQFVQGTEEVYRELCEPA